MAIKIKNWSIHKQQSKNGCILKGTIYRVFPVQIRIKRIELIRVGLIVYACGLIFLCSYGYADSKNMKATERCIDSLLQECKKRRCELPCRSTEQKEGVLNDLR